MNSHLVLIQLIIAYTLTGAFVFTVMITCCSLVGWIKLADKKQQKKLFQVLIVELCVVAVGFFSRVLEFNPDAAKRHIAINAGNLAFGITDQPNQLLGKTADWADPKWKEARDNIDWVWVDPGARSTFNKARSSGLTIYQSVLAVQAHNRPAQETILEYGEERTLRYISTLEKWPAS